MIPAVDPTSNAPEWTVSELAGSLRRTLEDRFGHVRVRGEIVGYRGPHSSGHAYFCLKDRDARLDAIVWRSAFGKLRFKPQEGLEVVATGKVTTFPGKSTYQLVIEQLEPAGAGALMALLDERRRTLAAEGLFAAERKRRPPFLPATIAVVTSPTGSVIRDILHRLADRCPRPVLIWPVRVQGETCGAEVAAAIAGLNALPTAGPMRRPDVIIVARGGGSMEDLWGFNDEAVVRAAAASAIPIISAIGHETDWTLLDHAADLRAPTPTGAAELAVPVWADLVAQVSGTGLRLLGAVRRGLEGREVELRSAARALPTPDGLLAARRQCLDLAATRLAPALLANARRHEDRLRRAGDALARHTPRLELATARTRLDAVGTKPARALGRVLADRRERMDELGRRLRVGRDVTFRAERVRIEGCRERLGTLRARGSRAVLGLLDRRATRVEAVAQLLASLGYRSVLERGYVLVRTGEGRPVARADEVAGGAILDLEFADGRRRAQAEGSRPDPGRPDPARPGRRASPLAQPNLFDM